ncbi:hypothetical protein LTR62_008235 [Meristemomyces frigidus]|uniref:DUF6314 domain-containing protein n=1 Tax=Meristemomyces frigidus TaxID=1508187 RepID=A0AAN7TI78_9PEZI|nr:hypothetical protein LTR62_008235 [Meristemomyces frigidus]
MGVSTPTKAIFDSLQGSWRMKRSLNSILPGFPSGMFEGTATFTPRRPGAHSVAGELLYAEQGELRTDNGFTLRANRKYIYRYNADEDKISTWFVKEDTKQVDGKEEIDYLFHDIENEGLGPAVVGRGEHLCELDMYWAYYEFRLPKSAGEGQRMDVFGVKYKVKGPQKDYTYVVCELNLLANRLPVPVPCKNRPRSGRSTYDLPLDQWTTLLTLCQQLRTITLRMHSETAWPGRIDIENTLVTFRTALEAAALPRLSEAHFTPIHAMGIVHLRWSGLGVFGFGFPSSRLDLPIVEQSMWQRLQTLDLQVASPFGRAA